MVFVVSFFLISSSFGTSWFCHFRGICIYIFGSLTISLPHADSNILRILPLKNENFQMKNSGSFHISTQNIDCGYLLEPPYEYPQSMFLSRNKKINVSPCKSQFYCIKVGFKRGQNYLGVFS